MPSDPGVYEIRDTPE